MNAPLSIPGFIAMLRELDVRLWVEDGRLRFSAPGGAVTSQLREQLRARKAELTAFIENAQSSLTTPAPELERTAVGEASPLSYGQEHLWLVEQLQPGNPAYNMPAAVRLTGAVDEAALRRALQALQQRHAVLRTTFTADDEGQPVQTPGAKHAELQVISTGVDPEGWSDWLRAFAQQPFDLAHGPLLRAALVRTAPAEHLLVLVTHHLAADAQSGALLLQELGFLYGALCNGGSVSLPEPAVHYGDYARWERNRLQGQVLEQKLAYWERRLRGMPTLDLPTDHVRPARRRFQGARHHFSVPPRLAEGAVELARERGATLYMVLLAAFQGLLHRYSGQTDIGIGASFAARQRTEFEHVPGHFANVAVMRTALDGSMTFTELLSRVRAVTLEAYEHQDAPFGLVVERLNPPRDPSRNPLFQVLFVLHNRAEHALSFGPLGCSVLSADAGTAQFDLTLSISEASDGLAAWLEYDTDLFESSTVRRMAQHLLTLLGAAVSDPERRLGTMPLLGNDEYRQIVVEWNRTAREYPVACLHRLVEAQVERSPDATALVFEDHELSYALLNAAANRLARHLQTQGVEPDVLVGVCAERSVEMVVGLLAVLKAGGAYVPLDPGYPEERLRYMVEDSAPALLLVPSSLLHLLPATGVPVVCLDRDEPLWRHLPEANLDATTTLDHLAYMIYTSGSTGRPKGVPNTHRGIANRLSWMQEQFPLGRTDHVLQKTPFSFDVSVWEFFWPLMTGAALVVARPGGHKDARYLAALIEAQRITTLHFVPSMLNVFLDAAELERCSGLKRVFCSGEALPFDTVQRFRAVLPAQLYNLYGPTEAAVDVTWWDCARDHDRRIVPIGRPVANTSIYLLDEHGQPVPVGVPGELHIGGVQLARGYHRRPELTEERFITHPGLGQRLYRTGDLARWLPDGNVEYLGRLDHQVKVRGQRIELGEIEAVLLEHGSLREAVLVAAEVPGGRELVAYVVPAPGVETADLATTLRSWLKARLPEYMVPSAFVELPMLPLSANGKVDRRALPGYRRTDTRSYVAPRTPMEERIAAIWQQALSVEQVGLQDNFFELGGHSLAAMQVVAQVHKSLGVEVPLRALFDAPTVAQFAGEVESLAVRGAEPLPVLQADVEHRHLPFPLSDVQRAYWLGRGELFEYGNSAAHLYQEIENEGLDLARLDEVVNLLIARHDALRLVVLDDGTQKILREVPRFEIAVTDLRGRPAPVVEAELEQVRSEMSHRIYDAGTWPLFNIRASVLDGGQVRLHVSLDLLIFDGSSLLILARELAALYQDPFAALPPLEISMRDFIHAERALHDTGRYRKSWTYWEARLDDFPAAPELPLMRRPELLAQPRFARLSDSLPCEAWTALKMRGAKRGLAPTHLVLAAFSEVLAAWSKNPRFALNLTLYHRPPLHPQLDHLVGDFTALEMLAIDRREGASFEQRAKAIQRRLWSDLDHRYVNGVQVLQALARHRGGSGSTMMPIVVTSLLHHKDAVDAISLPWEAGLGYGVSQTPQMWLDHQVIEVQGRLVFNWDVLQGLFPPGMIEDMLQAYRELLVRLAADEAAWSEASRSLLPHEQRLQREAVNATSAPLPQALLHELVEKRAQQSFQQPAVIAPGRSLTYGELVQRSRRIARWLRQQGAVPNTLVAVVTEKGWEQVVAVLAVLQSGAAYVPIDAGWPRERQHLLLQQADSHLVLTQKSIDQAARPWPPGVTVAAIDDEPLWAQHAEGPLESVQQPTDLAYVIYTSGSTGVPKGVMIDHRGAVNTVLDVNERFGVGPQDRVFALSALHFDLSVYDIFGLLAAGGAIVMPAADALREPSQWAAQAVDARVTMWNTVPALFELLVTHAERQGHGALAGLRVAMLSGDWIPVTLPQRAWSLAPQVRLHSLGGATEASIWSIAHTIDHVDAAWPSIPYGRPMRNQTFHVLDTDLNPRPTWVPGELYIGGIGVAHGYWRDEARTRSSFVLHPRTSERLYRTGDLGRYWPDGNIEFLGREDGQVKVGGHRIELGEIETAMAQHRGVKAAVVSTVGDKQGRRLVAHVVRSDSASRAVQPVPAPSSSRVDAVALPLPPPTLDADLQRSYDRRRTHRAFTGEQVPLEGLSALLSSLQARSYTPTPSRHYTSAGSLYAVRVYVVVKPGRVQGLEAGSYLYDHAGHRLLSVHPGAIVDAKLHYDFNRPVFNESAFSIFLVGDMAAVMPKYGDRSRSFCLLESGAMTQLLMLTAPAHGLGLCEMGDVWGIEKVQDLLAVDGQHELLHAMVGGVPDASRLPQAQAVVRTTPTDADFIEDLRQHLMAKLPAYMVPAQIVVQPSLPLSANGKVDRKALSETMIEAAPVHREAVAPQNDLQRELQACVRAELLEDGIGLPQLGIDDNFFDLGFTSTSVIRLHGRIKEALKREFSVIKLFEHANVRALSQWLGDASVDQTAVAEEYARAQKKQDVRARRRQLRGEG